jgi:polyamine oxidase
MASAPSVVDVIVIGAGIAGLATAQAVMRAGRKVVVLEAQARVGGRMLQWDTLGFPVDMGCGWIHGGGDNPLYDLARELNLPLHATATAACPLFDHDLESFALFDPARSPPERVSRETVMRVLARFQAALADAARVRRERRAGVVGTGGVAPDVGLLTALHAAGGGERLGTLSPEEARVLAFLVNRYEGWYAASLDDVSAAHFDQEDGHAEGHFLLPHTYGPLLAATAQGVEVAFGHEAVAVAADGVGATVRTRAGLAFAAPVVVVAVPLGVLKAGGLHFAPPLSAAKRAAVAAVGFGMEDKIVLRFDRVFWPNVDFVGATAADPADCAYFLNLHRSVARPALCWMVAGRSVAALEALSDAEVAAEAERRLRACFPGDWRVTGVAFKRWGADPFARGAYCYDAVGATPDM